ncbi:MAG: carbamoyltransferase [Elusimicrobiota bacterium]
MYLLGISCYYHDSACVLLKDGQLIAAAEEERFSRKKHDFGFPHLALKFCLKEAQISGQDLDYVVFYEKPFLKFERIIMSFLQTYPESLKFFREAMISWTSQKFWIKDTICSELGISPHKIFFTEHHISHAASSFLSSPFEEAAILTVDGVGEFATQTLGVGRGNKIDIISEQKFPHSVGLLYSAFTAFLGFEVNEGEYKVMGMAPYGEPKYLDKIYKTLRHNNDGSLYLDMSYFSHHYHTERTYTPKLEELFGPSRDPKTRFVTSNTSLYDNKIIPTEEEINRNQYYADIAASIQRVTEELLVSMAKYLYSVTKLKKICIAGGVGLNCVANYKILKETSFDELYLQPACGDSGGALGAALYFYYTVLNNRRNFILSHAYWGKAYTQENIGEFLKKNNIKYETLENEDKLLVRVVEYLIQGKVIGWFQGKFEWGPRALGNRSIIADPRRLEMKDILNIKIKFREPYMPFAPSILSENVSEYFEIQEPDKCYPLRFMLLAMPVRKNKRDSAPATTHFDGTSRIQAVHKDANPLYYALIKKFNGATGIPLILNTSFNLRGEPIVNTPENAFKTFRNSGMDVLVLGNNIVLK